MTGRRKKAKTIDIDKIARWKVDLEYTYVENPVAEAIVQKLMAYRAYVRAHLRYVANLPPSSRRATKVAVKVLPVLGESGVGKSVAFRQFILRSIEPEEEEQGIRRVLEVPLGQGASPRTMWCDVLKAYDDPLHDRGTKENLKRRACDFRDVCKTDVWVFDETNHLIDTDTDIKRWDVAEAMKSMSETNTVGMVLVGQENVLDIIRGNGQVGLRSEPLVHFLPLNLEKQALRKIATTYFDDYAKRMVELGTLTEKPDLAGDLFKLIAEVSYGRLGTGSQFVIHAAEYAWRAGMTRLEQGHFDAAYETWVKAHDIMSQTSRKRSRP